MSVFADTSALYAVLDRDDRFHDAAAEAWRSLLGDGISLVTTNYVLVECHALVQRRLGLEAARALATRVVPVLSTEFVDETDHDLAVTALLAAGRRDVSLVDFSSFQVMRRTQLRRAFAFDPHFSEQGFEIVPR